MSNPEQTTATYDLDQRMQAVAHEVLGQYWADVLAASPHRLTLCEGISALFAAEEAALVTARKRMEALLLPPSSGSSSVYAAVLIEEALEELQEWIQAEGDE